MEGWRGGGQASRAGTEMEGRPTGPIQGLEGRPAFPVPGWRAGLQGQYRRLRVGQHAQYRGGGQANMASTGMEGRPAGPVPGWRAGQQGRYSDGAQSSGASTAVHVRQLRVFRN